MKHKIKHIHFVGIGGGGMSGIAEVLLNLGYPVSGSDLAVERRHPAPAPTRRIACTSATPQRTSRGADAVVTSTAVNARQPGSGRRARRQASRSCRAR